MPSGIDQAWGFADPEQARQAGVKVVSGYLSWDDAKNWTAADVHAYHRVGIGVLLNWESQPGAPLNGAHQGHVDAAEAVRQARALIRNVGYEPQSKVVIIFSCDRDVSSGQYGAIDAYYRNARTVCHDNGFLVGVYGEADLVGHLSRAGITDVEWQTLAWSYGRIDPVADFYQSSINNTLGGASVDFDQLIHPDAVGAWWPPASTHDQPDRPHTLLEWIMTLPGAPKDLTYQKLLHDVQHAAGVGCRDQAHNIANAVWNADVIPTPIEAERKSNPTWGAKNAVYQVLSAVYELSSRLRSVENKVK